jgi:hypothetical protein
MQVGRRHTARGEASVVTGLILKRASASRSSGQWRDDDYDVLADGAVIRAYLADAGRAGESAMAVDARPWPTQRSRL